MLTVPWVGLQFVIVVFPDHTHLLFCSKIWFEDVKYQFDLNIYLLVEQLGLLNYFVIPCKTSLN